MPTLHFPTDCNLPALTAALRRAGLAIDAVTAPDGSHRVRTVAPEPSEPQAVRPPSCTETDCTRQAAVHVAGTSLCATHALLLAGRRTGTTTTA